MKQLFTWLAQKLNPNKSGDGAELRRSGVRISPGKPTNEASTATAKLREKKKPDVVEFDTNANGSIEDGGPGKNVLIRNRYVREDSGTHDNLKILDESVFESDEEVGFDPYNTGQFDRSKSWAKRSRK